MLKFREAGDVHYKAVEHRAPVNREILKVVDQLNPLFTSAARFSSDIRKLVSVYDFSEEARYELQRVALDLKSMIDEALGLFGNLVKPDMDYDSIPHGRLATQIFGFRHFSVQLMSLNFDPEDAEFRDMVPADSETFAEIMAELDAHIASTGIIWSYHQVQHYRNNDVDLYVDNTYRSDLSRKSNEEAIRRVRAEFREERSPHEVRTAKEAAAKREELKVREEKMMALRKEYAFLYNQVGNATSMRNGVRAQLDKLTDDWNRPVNKIRMLVQNRFGFKKSTTQAEYEEEKHRLISELEMCEQELQRAQSRLNTLAFDFRALGLEFEA